MGPDCVDWDEPDDPGGNVRHVAAADLTPAEVEEVLDDPDAPAEPIGGQAQPEAPTATTDSQAAAAADGDSTTPAPDAATSAPPEG